MSFAETKLIPALEPWNNASVEVLAQALATMFDPISEVLEGSGDLPIWGKVLSASEFPSKYNPQYLAQFAGVLIPPGTSFAEAIKEGDIGLDQVLGRMDAALLMRKEWAFEMNAQRPGLARARRRGKQLG